jgi:hypothetical protein
MGRHGASGLQQRKSKQMQSTMAEHNFLHIIVHSPNSYKTEKLDRNAAPWELSIIAQLKKHHNWYFAGWRKLELNNQEKSYPSRLKYSTSRQIDGGHWSVRSSLTPRGTWKTNISLVLRVVQHHSIATRDLRMDRKLRTPAGNTAIMPGTMFSTSLAQRLSELGTWFPHAVLSLGGRVELSQSESPTWSKQGVHE